MEQEPRKATDVLLDIESKVNTLVNMVQTQDLIIKILSNKLNDVLNRLAATPQVNVSKAFVEAVQVPPAMPAFPQMPPRDPERNIAVTAESKLPQDSSPQGFRRNSRPETYAGDNAFLSKPQEPRMPVQLPPKLNAGPVKPPPGRSLVPDPIFNAPLTKNSAMAGTTKHSSEMPTEHLSRPPQSGQIPVMQRCVDKSGKSVFLADVEILDKDSLQPVFKTRTNGTGKWMASLGIGMYRVIVRKRISLSKEQMEAIQDIQVDGTQVPLELPMIIIK